MKNTEDMLDMKRPVSKSIRLCRSKTGQHSLLHSLPYPDIGKRLLKKSKKYDEDLGYQ
ncbi:MAG: hypothetical protein ACLUTO_00420 [Anaerostipes sp.]